MEKREKKFTVTLVCMRVDAHVTPFMPLSANLQFYCNTMVTIPNTLDTAPFIQEEANCVHGVTHQ